MSNNVTEATSSSRTVACATGKHKACRGRVLNPDARRSKDRWSACGCPCPHDRGPLAEAYGAAEVERAEAAAQA